MGDDADGTGGVERESRQRHRGWRARAPRGPRPAGVRRRPRKSVVAAAVALLLAAFAWVNNTSLLGPAPEGPPRVLAHRGLAQTFDTAGVGPDTCTADRIRPPEHGYLENTIPGMRAAFDAGADMVELDVHHTVDGGFAVFHDWKVDCRTDGTGTTRDLTMRELKRLDIGHGYTPDGGSTHPFRGKGVGMMPSLDEVLAEFPREPLLVHTKSDRPEEGAALARRLARLPRERLDDVTVYGADEPVAALQERLPELRVMSKRIMAECLLSYEAVGWTGYVPGFCAHRQLHVPERYAPWLWGWPSRFVERMRARGTRVVLVAGSGDLSEGFDSRASLRRVPDDYTGMVWTNRADATTPSIHARGG